MARENCSKSDGSEIEVKVQFHQQVRDYQQLTESETGGVENPLESRKNHTFAFTFRRIHNNHLTKTRCFYSNHYYAVGWWYCHRNQCNLRKNQRTGRNCSYT